MILIGTGIGDEGGFAPPVHDAIETFGLLQRAVAAAGHESVVRFGLDPASSEFFRHGQYDLGFKDLESKQEPLTGQKLGDIYRELAEKFPLVLLEDPFAEDDWESWRSYLKQHKDAGDKFELVGDDLLATNVKRMKLAFDNHGM